MQRNNLRDTLKVDNRTTDLRAKSRKRFLIEPRFQGALALFSLIGLCLTAGMYMITHVYFDHLFHSKALSLGLSPDHELVSFVDRQQNLIAVVFIAAIFLAGMVNVIISLMFSHRIAGSLLRLTNVINQTEDLAGVRSIAPRKSDFFVDLYEAYNHLVARLKS